LASAVVNDYYRLQTLMIPEPLLVPTEDERVGYVPNVVYSCGSMIHNDKLVIPYAISDQSTTFALVSLPELLAELAG